MQQFKFRDFYKLLNSNGYYLNRTNGSHAIFVNHNGMHISIPLAREIKSVIALRLIKQYNLS